MRNKGLKRLALVAVAAGLLFALSAGPAFAGTAGGSFGDGLKWKLDTDSGVMTISGSGAIPNYKYNTYKETWGRPWEKYTKKIKAYLSYRYGDYMKLPSEEQRQAAVHAYIFDINKDYTCYIG